MLNLQQDAEKLKQKLKMHADRFQQLLKRSPEKNLLILQIEELIQVTNVLHLLANNKLIAEVDLLLLQTTRIPAVKRYCEDYAGQLENKVDRKSAKDAFLNIRLK